ncbi:hypothetical protein C8R45DRAFT_972517 [Mycena sanguinolenta]|nr:hypothetical protein C8R45DRAFT_972517 [Mycena sanguinolenta]
MFPSPSRHQDSQRSIGDHPALGSNLTLISYEAPKLVQSQINAWINTVQSAATVTVLFAIMSAIILGIVKMDGTMQGTSSAATTLLAVASYAAILFNSITTLASLLFIDRLGDIELNDAGNPNRHVRTGFVERPLSSLRLLTEYGARKHVRWIFYQWLLYFFVGVFFLLAQIIVYMWLREGQVLSIVLTAIAGASTLVLLFTSFYDRE